MSDPLFQLNGKVVRSPKVEHTQLQSISLYAHDDDDSKFKALSLNEDRELLVSNEGNKIHYSNFNSRTLQPNESYTFDVRGTDFSLLVIGNNISDLEPTIMISHNNNDFVGLSTSFYEEDITSTSRQIRLNKFNMKHTRLIFTNLNQSSSITFVLNMSYLKP